MKKILFTIAVCFSFTGMFAQSEDFESVSLDSGKVLNGSQGETEFTFEYNFADLHLPVFWDTSWGGIWSGGWAISRKYDSATVASDFARHLYCVKPFRGFNQSETFVVGQNGSYLHRDRGSREGIGSFYITNTTYAWNSMKLGDGFAKKFGGASGNDSDYFFCRVRCYGLGDFLDSQDVYLADFRNGDNSQDYILSEWKQVLTHPNTDSISFELYSSDNSSWGMNTPAFFAIDAVGYMVVESTVDMEKGHMEVYPNPAADRLTVKAESPVIQAGIYNLNGQLVKLVQGNHQSEMTISTGDLIQGMYSVSVLSESGIVSQNIVISR